MSRHRVGQTAAVAAAGAAAAGVAGALGVAGVRRYLAREYAREDPAAVEDFSALDDARHHTVAGYDGASLHVVDRGPLDARPLLFVHGVTLAAEVWRYQLRDLAGDFRVLAVDQRGHGRSTVGRDGFGLDRLARDLAAVLQELELRDVLVVGHSMGGFATMQFCIDFADVVEDRVAGIVLANTSCGQLLGRRGERFLPIARRVVAAGSRRPQRTFPHLAYLGARYTLGKEALPTHVRLTHQLSEATRPETAVGSVLAFLDMDLHHRLRDVTVPAVVVTGSHDRLTPPASSRRIAAALPAARLVVLPGCGHMSMLERHHELGRLVTDFATELGTGVARAGIVGGPARPELTGRAGVRENSQPGQPRPGLSRTGL